MGAAEDAHKSASTSNVPVVVLSVGSPPDTAQRSGASPHDDHLFAELGRAIDSGLGSSRVLLVEDDQDLAAVVIGGFARTVSTSTTPQHSTAPWPTAASAAPT